MDESREGAPPQACDEIAGAILRYLHAHPHAADTFSGIARWWLARESGPVSTSALECALQRLVAGGQVARELLGDGACIFRRGPALGGENGTEPS
jgi:hypothetical protein